jgi:NAD(P)-dependent dehydrogenase (short-subunit alcohol dehydrogenase family)
MDNATVLVTGASRGIGRATVDRLAAAGADVIGIARNPAGKDFPGTFYVCDLVQPDATARLLSEIVIKHHVCGIVNNAGLNHIQQLDDVEIGKFNDVINVNLLATILCTQAVIPAMRKQGYGRIVNISSRGALGRPGRTSYGAAKAGVMGMTRTWALELAADGITANVVSPGPIATEMFLTNNDGVVDQFTRDVPMRRLGKPEEVAAAIEFLLSPNASYITGQTLHVCGGSSIGIAPF